MCHCLVPLLLIVANAYAQVSTLSISSDQKLAAPRWMYDGKIQPKSNKLISLLIEARRFEQEKNVNACVASLEKAQALGRSLSDWLALAELRCALIPEKKSEPILLKAAGKVEKALKGTPRGSLIPKMRGIYAKALVQLAELQVKGNRRLAWGTIDRAQQFKDVLAVDERARLYQLAGELAFIEQNLPNALDFFTRSVNEKDSPELRTKLESIRVTLLGKKEEKIIPESKPQRGAPDLGVSPQEQNYFDRMNNAISSQDYVSAVEDGMQLITKFPGGTRAQDATEKILDIYLSIASNSDEKYRHIVTRVVKQILGSDAGRLLRFAQAAYNRSLYINALDFAEKAYEKFGGHPDSMRALLLAGKSALACGEYGTSEEAFDRVTVKGAGSRESIEAMFRLGLLKFRLKKYSEAVAQFERVLAVNADGDFEYRALYWEWRALQHLDTKRASEYVNRLTAKYPVTYYGLRALAEQNNGLLQFANLKKPIKVEMRLLASERLSWERFLILLEAGWFEEAQVELQDLPEPQTLSDKLLRARLWALAFKYDKAIGLANRTWEKSPDLVLADSLSWVYPKEYATFVKPYAERQKVSEAWIYSIMRQESSYQKDAKSSSNALGLMQLLPATGQQLADEFKLKKFVVPDSLFDPQINIQLGVVYFSRLVGGFSGNIPMALAAYNAGPARLRRWTSARKDLEGLEAKASSDPETELWIDELPWEETSLYVKAILRNYLIYQFLDAGKVQVIDPVWKS